MPARHAVIASEPDQQGERTRDDHERDLVRILELAAVTDALLHRVGAEQADVLAAILETRLAVGGVAAVDGVTRAAVGMAVDLARELLPADALLRRQALMEADERDEQDRGDEDAGDHLERAEPLDAVRDGAVEREQDRHLDALGDHELGNDDRGRDDRPHQERDRPGQRGGADGLQATQADIDDPPEKAEGREQV
jgi:hypothetical protein